MKRREVLALLVGATAAPHVWAAQERIKVARVGYLGPAPAASFAPRVEALRAGLQELGYIEGKDVDRIEHSHSPRTTSTRMRRRAGR